MRLFSFLALAVLCLTQPANADLIISIDDATVTAGESTFLNVWIESDHPGGDLIQSTSFEFLITSSSPRRIEFNAPQNDGAFASADYVFSGNSYAQLDSWGPYPLGHVGGANNQQYAGGDESYDFTNVTITSRKLLVSLDVTAITAISGDEFQVTLSPPLASSFHSVDPQGDYISVSFTSTPGTVTVIGPLNAVPEPTSLALLATSVPCVLLAYRQRKRGRTPFSS